MTNIPLNYLQNRIGKFNDQTPSGLGRWLNARIVEAERGYLRAAFVVREDMTNPTKMLHGGAISAIMDEMIGGTVLCLGKPVFFTSINLNVDFFAPAHIDDELEAICRVIKEGRQIVYAECELYLIKKKRLIAKSSSNLIRTEIPVVFNEADV